MASGLVLRAQQGLADTIRGGLRDIGQRRVQDAHLGLAETKLNFDIGRQTQQDKLNLPGQQLEARDAQAKLDAGNKPFHIQDTGLGPYSALNFVTPDKHGRSAMDEISGMLGVTHDPESGNWLKQDGSVLTSSEVFGDSTTRQNITNIMTLHTDPEKAVEDMRLSIDDREADGTMTPEDATVARTRLKEMDNPENKLAMRMEWQKKLDAMPTELGISLQTAKDRNNSKIKGLQDSINKGAEREFDLQKIIATGAQKRQTQREKLRLGGGGDDPATLKIARHLLKIGAARDAREAFEIASSKKGNSKAQWMQDYAIALRKSDEFISIEKIASQTEDLAAILFPKRKSTPSQVGSSFRGPIGAQNSPQPQGSAATKAPGPGGAVTSDPQYNEVVAEIRLMRQAGLSHEDQRNQLIELFPEFAKKFPDAVK